MKKKTRTKYYKFYPTLIFISILFMSIGYAVINSVILNVNGEVLAENLNGIYITEVKVLELESIDIDWANTEIINARQTVLHSNIKLSNSNCNSYATLEISMYNSTNNVYSFDTILYDQEFYSNNNITYQIVGMEKGSLLDAKKTITFKIKFYYLESSCSTISTSNTLESYLYFNFKLEQFRWDSYKYTGFEQLEVKEKTNTNLKMEIKPKNGAYDRIVFPIEQLEVGEYYTLSFTENKKSISGNSYINASSEYAYGTTVTTKEIDDAIGTAMKSFLLPEYFNYSNEPKHTAFMWKEPFLELNYKEGRTYEVSLTFYAEEETMYWMWDFANINNNTTIEFNINNVSLRKIEYNKSAPYFYFVDTTFNTWDYPQNAAQQKYLKYSYRTSATENELDLRVETGSGWEYFNIPIKNLTIGKNYKISYSSSTTPTALTINTSNIYGNTIRENSQTVSNQIIKSSDSSTPSVNIINQTGDYQGILEFTATANEMYWVWQCGGINNNQWANIKINNVVLEEIN